MTGTSKQQPVPLISSSAPCGPGKGNSFTGTGMEQPGIRGVASDYAYLCAGLLDLYELTFSPEYLEAAIGIEEYFSRHFLDRKDGGYFTSHDEDTDLLIRQKDIYDGALPSVNSVALKNLVRLGLMTTNPVTINRHGTWPGHSLRLLNSHLQGIRDFFLHLILHSDRLQAWFWSGSDGAPEWLP